MFNNNFNKKYYIKDEYNNNLKKQIKDYLNEENINREEHNKENEFKFNIFFKRKKNQLLGLYLGFFPKIKIKINVNNNNNNKQILKEVNPILNEKFNNPYLMKKKDNSIMPNIFMDNTQIIKNDIKIQEKENDDITH